MVAVFVISQCNVRCIQEWIFGRIDFSFDNLGVSVIIWCGLLQHVALLDEPEPSTQRSHAVTSTVKWLSKLQFLAPGSFQNSTAGVWYGLYESQWALCCSPWLWTVPLLGVQVNTWEPGPQRALQSQFTLFSIQSQFCHGKNCMCKFTT